MWNEKTNQVFEANDLDKNLAIKHIIEFKNTIELTNKTSIILLGKRLFMRNHYSCVNYHLYLVYDYCKQLGIDNKYFELKINKMGKLGIFIKKDYECHHIDGDKLNDKIENLILVTKEKHNFLDGQLELLKRGKITISEYWGHIELFSLL